MKKGDKVWFNYGILMKRPGIIESNCCEGYYWIRNTEKNTIHYCFINEIELR